MIVIMEENATEQQISKVVDRLVNEGFDIHRSTGARHTVLGAVGARITEVVVNHHPRRFGKTKYGLERTVKVILDLFTVKFLLDYSHKPMRLFGGTGMLLITSSAILLFYLFFRRFFEGVAVLGSPLFQLGVMFFILGFQSILMGLIAELLARTYHESQSKTTYTVRKKINLP